MKTGHLLSSGIFILKLLFLAPWLLFFISSCSEDTIPVSRILLSEENIYIGVGNQLQLRATIVPWNASNKSLTWYSENDGIATVDNNGTVTAISSGITRINIMSYDKNAISSCLVTVVKPSLSSARDYQLVFCDEFDYDGMPNQTIWEAQVWRKGVVNNELQEYINDPIIANCSDGILSINALCQGNNIISGRFHSIPLFQYGYFEARIKIPKGKGVWPAFWLMGIPTDWPLCGEVDILEAVGHMPTMVHSVIWSQEYSHNEVMVDYYLPTSRDEFHIYAAEIDKESVKIYVDNILVNELRDEKKGINYFPYNDQYQYTIVLNLAFGGDFGGAEGVDYSSLPASFEIDYVRVFSP